MLEFQNISKQYDQHLVVSDINFKVEQGELVVLIGPSGCGKTTLLKMINRLVKPSSGDIFINGRSIFTQNEVELRRNIGYVIQQTGLFPHMTVRQNIEIIPKLQKVDKEQIAKRSIQLMEMVGLDPQQFLDRYPFQLSGGQQQRIGVARAFACDPEIILMDEPFSALDPITRSQLQDELADLQSKVQKTIVFVTHDMNEAIKIADKICLLHEGKIVQYDTVEEIMKNPANDYVAGFIGRNRIWSSPEFIRAQDIMITNPVSAFAQTTTIRCIEKMRLNQVDSLMIVNRQNKLLGVVFAQELQMMKNPQQAVSEIMQSQCPTIPPDMNIVDILELMNEGNSSSIPVVDEHRNLLGLITKSSLLTTLSRQYSNDESEVAQ
ncbi:MAG: ABC transporter ATP-binding protein [Eubacteriales bacterium]